MKYEYEILYRINGVPEFRWYVYGIRYDNENIAKSELSRLQLISTLEFKLMRRQVGEWEEVAK